MKEIKVEDELRVIEMKRENLCKALEKVRSQSSELLFFTLQWSDLEDSIKFAEGNVEKKSRQVESKEIELEKRSVAIEERAKVVEAAEAKMGDLVAKANGFRREIEEKGKELDLLKNQIDCCNGEYKAVEIRLTQLKASVEEWTAERRSKISQVSQLEEQLVQIKSDVERHRVEISAENERLVCSQTRRGEVEEEIERKTKVLKLVVDKTMEHEKLLETLCSELKKTQDELDLNGEQLGKMKTDRNEVSAEIERRDMNQARNRELEEEIERKREDLTVILNTIADNGKQVETLSLELKKTQDDLDLKGEQLGQMKTDLERHRNELSAEKEHLEKNKTCNSELEEEIERKREDLTAVLNKIADYEKQIELKEEQLRQMKTDLDRNQTRNSELEEEFERKSQDLSTVLSKFAGYEKLLESVEAQLGSQQKLLETRSSEEKELKKELEEAKRRVILDLDLAQERVDSLNNDMKVTRQKMESKAKELEDIEKMIEERNAHCDSIKSLIDEHNEELASKEKKQDEITESIRKKMESKAKELEDIEKVIDERNAHCDSIKSLIDEHNEELASKEKKQDEITESIRKLSYKIVSEEKTLERAELFIQQLSAKQRAKEDKLESTRRDLKSKKKKLCSVKDRLEGKEEELDSLQSFIEKGEKKLQDLDNSNESLIKQIQVKKEEICSLENGIRECSSELDSKRKERDQVQRSITDLTAELTSKEHDLNSVKKEIQESLKDLEEQQVRFGLNEKQFSARSEKMKLKEKELVIQTQLKKEEISSLNNAIRECSSELEAKREELDQVQSSIADLNAELTSLKDREQEIVVKEKELDARKEKLDEKDQLLQTTEERLAKCVKDFEGKAKQLSSFCKQKTPDQQVDLVRDAKLKDEKTLQLLLRGHLKKCDQLYLDVSRSLEASSDPAKLVLDTIQGLYSAHQMAAVTNLGPNSVRRSSMYLLECLMDASLKPMTEAQGEAIEFVTEWKRTTIVNADNPVEVLGFLHFLAAFSLAYSFDADKVQKLFDVAFLRKYAPSLCEALGLSALAPVKDVISLEDKPEEQPREAPIHNSNISPSPSVQENAAVSQSANENALLDSEGSASLSREEVSSGLRAFKDPRRTVLDYVEEAIRGAHQRGELGLAEPIVKTLALFLEELMLTQDTNSINPRLQVDAMRLANEWRSMRGSAQMSPLEAWGFLLLIAAYGLVDRSSQDNTLKFATYVAHFNQAPRLFQSLRLSHAVPNLVCQLLSKQQYIPAIRFISFFNLKTMYSPVELLKQEIAILGISAKLKRQAEGRDAGKLREIIQVIEDLKLEIDLPVDLIVRFMVPREIQTQNQCLASSSSVPVQQLHHMQASDTFIHSSYIARHGANASPQSTGYRRGNI